MKRIGSGIMLTLFLIGMLTLAFNIHPVKAGGMTEIWPVEYLPNLGPFDLLSGQTRMYFFQIQLLPRSYWAYATWALLGLNTLIVEYDLSQPLMIPPSEEIWIQTIFVNITVPVDAQIGDYPFEQYVGGNEFGLHLYGCFHVVGPPAVEDTEAYIDYVNETIQDLPDEIFNKPGEDVPDVKNDFSDLFDDALENIDEGNYEGAIEKLDRIKIKIYEEIVECAERQEIISLIDDLIAYLETL